jgi:bifunctional DNA-binding transcriptional regulator/antitoxin component of YhaV-PrlF toxin-antitoxin module
LAAPPAYPGSAATDVLYRLSSVDASGRISDRVVTDALGWCAGDRLTLTATGGIVLIRRDRDGPVTLPPRPRIAIPAGLRRRCRLSAGDQVLLAAYLSLDAIAAYSLPVVDRALHPSVSTAQPAHEQGHDA